jgi:hypothetical protein
MSKDLKPTINRLIERREMQLDEIAVLQIIHTNKKEGVTEKEELAKINMTLTKLADSEAEVLNEIEVYKNLLETL